MTPIVTIPAAIGSPGYSSELPREEESVPLARSLVRSSLSAWGLDYWAGVAELVVSELATNAVKHGAGRWITVRVTRSRDDRVRVSVTDGSLAMPIVKRPSPDSVSGRGLLLVNEMTNGWGTDLSRRAKTVWAEIEVTEAPYES
ncbi:ATP-binding protein [Streptomyces huasconensis]|uniref:ATP-binding protein n=1 Tax=Streptomyces huasconensis TaxID=1854574 RepID=UPI0033DAD64D